MQEVFKDIQGYNGYQVSNLGNVKSLRGIKRQSVHRDGYLQAALINEQGRKTSYVHRLVALAFIEKVEGKEYVNHINGNKKDNRVENLEWCTKSENSKHSFRIGTQCNKGIQHPGHRLTESDVREIRAKFQPRVCTRDMLSKEYGVEPCTIKAIVLNRLWKHVA